MSETLQEKSKLEKLLAKNAPDRRERSILSQLRKMVSQKNMLNSSVRLQEERTWITEVVREHLRPKGAAKWRDPEK